jgi:UDP-perosamine 4-acetyltransferase
VYVIGGGGHGRVALDAVLAAACGVAGIVDPRLTRGERLLDVEVVGDDEWLRSQPCDAVLLVNGIGANPSTRVRRDAFCVWRGRGYEFMSFVHPSAVVARDCKFEPGAQVMAGAIVQCGAHLAENTVVNTGARIDHDARIAAHAFIAPGVVLSGNVVVEEGAFIGAAAVVLPGVRIGAQAIVGAGAVVLGDVPAGWTVVGNPGVRIGAVN